MKPLDALLWAVAVAWGLPALVALLRVSLTLPFLRRTR